MTVIDKLRIGTRGSPLALTQTNQIIEMIKSQHINLQQPGALEIVVIKTTGDREQSRLLAEIGGKGLFTKELDEAMLRDEIDIAIHSMKDMPTFMPEGIVLHAISERLDSRDAFISQKSKTIMDLPKGATVGTASMRRRAQLLNLRPDLRIVAIRGNVDTRLKKIADGEVDATILAFSGLKRLEKEDLIMSVIDFDDMLPAVGQGILAATCREDDLRANTFIASMSHPATTLAVLAERAMLAVLDGSCHTPIAGHGHFDTDEILTLRGLILHPDGIEKAEVSLSGKADEAEKLGTQVAERLILKAGPLILDAIKQNKPVLIKPPANTGIVQSDSGNEREDR